MALRSILMFSIASLTIICSGNNRLFSQALQPVPKTPDGWEKSTDRSQRATAFTMSDLDAEETLVVKFYQREPLDLKQGIEQWLDFRMTTGRPPLGGKWIKPAEIVRQSGNMADGSREFEVDGKKHVLKGLAVGVDNVHVRFAAIIRSDSAAVRKHQSDSSQLLYKLFEVEKQTALKEGRGTDIEANPPKVKNLTAGGRIKSGRYVGNAVNTRTKKAATSYQLLVFENGEYEISKPDQRKPDSGRLVYSNATGRLNICDGFENSTYRPGDEYCVYGKEKTGKFVIFSRDGAWQRKLVWVSENDQPSPSEVARAKEIAKAEAQRYKHVVEPGKGINDDEIEVVLYAWETNYRSGAVQLDNESFLLMKDGRVLDGLPTAPDSLDLAASRSREPDRWGWWKKEKDGRYNFAWPVRPRDYRQPGGKQVIGLPFKKGARLDGDFGSTATQTMIASGYSSVQYWGIKLSRNGRFLKYRNGSTQIGGVPGSPALTTAMWDDEGAVTATLSESVTAQSKSKNNRLMTDRMGSYELDGYRLTLKFDDGHSEHHGTFTDAGQKVVWFEGSRLSKRKK